MTSLRCCKCWRKWESEVVAVSDVAAFWHQVHGASFDLLLLDHPLGTNVTGLDVCREVRRNPALECLPIVFFTASNDRETITEIFASGADDYVQKPVDQS